MLTRTRALDAALEAEHDPSGFRALNPRDRALARAIAGVTLRRFGTLRGLIAEKLDRGLPKKCGAARGDPRDRGRAGALSRGAGPHRGRSRRRGGAGRPGGSPLRRPRQRGAARRSRPRARPTPAPGADLPPWLYARWEAAYGVEKSRRGSPRRSPSEPPLDLTVKIDPRRLGRTARRAARCRPAASGSRRSGPVPELAGLRGRRLVGAGRRRRDSREAVRRPPGQARDRPLRRAGRQDRPARGGRRRGASRSTNPPSG